MQGGAVRSQTTKGQINLAHASQQQTNFQTGIWMCRAQGKNLLLMDVEGADGREKAKEKVIISCPERWGGRSERHTCQDFERKSAIFSLACSEIVVINLWENQVGLQDGANMSLLQTVFEVNLKLFGSQDESLGAAYVSEACLSGA